MRKYGLVIVTIVTLVFLVRVTIFSQQGTVTRMLLFSSDGKSLVSAGGILSAHDGIELSGSITFCNLMEQSKFQTYTLSDKNIYWISYTLDNNEIIASDSDGNLVLWNIREQKVKQQLPTRLSSGIVTLGNYKFFIKKNLQNAPIQQSLIKLHETIKRLNSAKSVKRDIICVSSNMKVAGIIIGTSSMELWDISSNKVMHEISINRNASRNSIILSNDGALLITGKGSKIYIWDTKAGKVIKTIVLPIDYVNALAISDNKELIGIADGYGRVEIWSIKQSKLIKSFRL